MKRLIITSLCLLFIAASPVFSVPLVVYSEDTPEQDPLWIEGDVHELGDFVFPPEEEIYSMEQLTSLTACDGAPGDDPMIPNILVEMRNLTNTDWHDVHYVADPEIWISNYDGKIGNAGIGDGTLAFRIDYQGMNVPLIFESIAADEVFQAGETWQFIIQDFGGFLGGPAPGPATPFDSIGIASMSDNTLFPGSTGSIIAVPEPATICLLTLGGLALLRKRKA